MPSDYESRARAIPASERVLLIAEQARQNDDLREQLEQVSRSRNQWKEEYELAETNNQDRKKDIERLKDSIMLCSGPCGNMVKDLMADRFGSERCGESTPILTAYMYVEWAAMELDKQNHLAADGLRDEALDQLYQMLNAEERLFLDERGQL